MGTVTSKSEGTESPDIGESSVDVEPEKRAQMLWRFLNQVKPDFFKDPNDKVVWDLLGKTKQFSNNAAKYITVKGFRSHGVYFVLSGEAHVLCGETLDDMILSQEEISEEGVLVGDDLNKHDSTMVINVIRPGDFFGEGSIFFDMTCSATVKTQPNCSLMLLPRECLEPVIGVAALDLATWFTQRRYLPTTSESQSKNVAQLIAVSVLKAIALFNDWPRKALWTLVDQLPDWPLVLYPTGAVLLDDLDPIQQITILVKGRVSVYAHNMQLTEVEAIKLPFLFGEEGLFNPDTVQVLTVKAELPCLVIKLPLHWIENVINNVGGMDAAWSKECRCWDKILKRRDASVYERYREKLQVEMLYKCLRENALFGSCPPTLIYKIARQGTALIFNPKEIVQEGADVLVYVCFGKFQIIKKRKILKIYEEGDMYYKYNDEEDKKTQQLAVTETLLVTFAGEDVGLLVKQFPKDTVQYLHDLLEQTG